MISNWTIHIQPQTPSKPAMGMPCNGCGVCCLSEPCPLGMVLSGRRRGACAALRWQDDFGAYRCGAMIDPEAILRQALAPWLRGLAPVLGPVLKRLSRRWIAAGSGCDSSLDVEIRPQSDRQ